MDKEEVKKHLFVLILCGGGGTRLWPRSRNKLPKQFAKLFDKKTLFQKTVDRLEGLVPWQRVFVVTTTRDYAAEVRKEAPRIPKENIIDEPLRRNTALAHGLGALFIQKIDSQAIIINLYADQLIQKENQFRKIELVAAQAAGLDDYLVAIGIKPTRIHTGLGHIHAKKAVRKIEAVPVYRLKKFTEKPDYKTAKKFLATGEYYWNAGMYVWSATSFLKALRRHARQTHQALEKIEKALGTKEEKAVIKAAYQKAPDISVDYAVSEKAKNFLMVPADMGWTDIGDWGVIWELSKKDKAGNAVIQYDDEGGFVGIEAKNNLIQFDDQLIALVGVENLLVVDTDDAILICRKDRPQDVKKMVKLLKKKGREKYL